MQNFEFFNPTKIVFGDQTIARLADLVPPTARVLILYGGASARKNGTLAEVEAALGEREVFEFAGIEPNPSYETMMRAVAQVREQQIDFLLAVGGGSVIDGTKFVAAAVDYAGDPWEILATHGASVKRALPFGSVLTLPATGSEMNNGAVITRQSTHTKFAFLSAHVFPQFSILDPTKTYTLPPKQIANGVADAFVHIVEQYLTYPVGGLAQDRFAEGLLQTLIEVGPQALAAPNDYDIRANLMWVATLALNGLIGAGVPQDWATHMIGHELTAEYGIDHARTLAIVLPALLRNQLENKKVKLAQMGRSVFNLAPDVDLPQRTINAIEQLFRDLGVPVRLSEAGVTDPKAAELIAAGIEGHGMRKLGEKGVITPDVVREIVAAAA